MSTKTKRQQRNHRTTTSKTNTSKKHYTRPGVEAAAQLVQLHPISEHVQSWDKAYAKYDDMIKAKGGAKLVKLDKQMNDVAKCWQTAKESSPSLTKEELLDIIIGWKFTIGKPRNALKPLLNSNSKESVGIATKLAFEAADEVPYNDTSDKYTGQITSAMNHICDELKGVGPATASAILCLYRPDIFAFMHDEVIECLYDGKRGYTLKIYLAVNDKCREISNELNMASDNDDDESTKWTACKVGKALWAVATMSAIGDESGLSSIFGTDAGGSIPACVSKEEDDNRPKSTNKRAKKAW